ncbi:MAG TPA: trypsin-like peptidase domain-containing protein [Burkholderiales bacterium]|nr:trypsin-like peptidase domain-containing protein [Burkholderiales bacterium]
MTERASRILCLLVAAAMPGIAGAKTPEQIFQLASQSVVVVQAQDAEGNPINQGGGVVTGRELVTTNCHVIEGAAAIEVLYRYQSYAATPASAKEDRDLCQIRVPELVAPRAKLNTGRVRVGQRVYAIGAPEGLELTLTEGLISSLREFDGSQYIQTSAAIAQGSSGGGLFDTEARLIGITSFFVGEGSSLNFALPAAWIVELERGVGARAGGQEPAEARWVRRIGDARAKKDWPGVVSLSQQWVRAMPRNARAWRELGDAYAATNRPRRAIPAYQQAVRYDAESFDAWHNLGWTYLALNQYDRAIEAIQEALRITPGHARAIYNLGAAYYGQGLRDKVQDVHIQLRKVNPTLAGQFAKRYVKP